MGGSVSRLTTVRASRLAEHVVAVLITVGGGPTVVRDFLAAGLVDYMHLVQVSIVLGRGVRAWEGLERLGGVTHLTFDRKVS